MLVASRSLQAGRRARLLPTASTIALAGHTCIEIGPVAARGTLKGKHGQLSREGRPNVHQEVLHSRQIDRQRAQLLLLAVKCTAHC